MKLLDAVECIIECSKCDNKTGGFGISDQDLADDAKSQGWSVTRAENVICPKCKRKKK